MNIENYHVEEKDNHIKVNDITSFDLKNIFECGQAFRWRRNDDGTYLVIAKERVIKLAFSGKTLIIYNSNTEDFRDIWFEYFDLYSSYEEIKEKLKKDEIMKKAVDFGHGIRILKQDFWEMLISFIISANNRIPMIMKVIDEISKKYGEMIEFEDEKFYTFPTPEKLAGAKLKDLELCKAGYRCDYILDTSRRILKGYVNVLDLVNLSTDEAEKKLKGLKGVGPKVADCILLFSGIKKDVFPTDVWIKRIMESLYFHKEASLKEIKQFATDYFGELAGIAQQYLFYYARENKISI
jgi:N-glycosylase/DNA lyase